MPQHSSTHVARLLQRRHRGTSGNGCVKCKPQGLSQYWIRLNQSANLPKPASHARWHGSPCAGRGATTGSQGMCMHGGGGVGHSGRLQMAGKR
jgi:hypothetical protein